MPNEEEEVQFSLGLHELINIPPGAAILCTERGRTEEYAYEMYTKVLIHLNADQSGCAGT